MTNRQRNQIAKMLDCDHVITMPGISMELNVFHNFKSTILIESHYEVGNDWKRTAVRPKEFVIMFDSYDASTSHQTWKEVKEEIANEVETSGSF